MAALRAGIFRLILPRQNLQDLEEIPKDLKRKITLIPVDHLDQVLEAALESIPLRRAARPTIALGESRAPVASAKSR